nr:lactobin A/cerein 7B family class IIb bacteriocin [uncultured Bacteroides sp.]
MKELENKFEIQDLTLNEMKEVNGGWLLAAITLAGAFIYVYNNWDDFAGGVKEGWSR